jgi:hypothetical protein
LGLGGERVEDGEGLAIEPDLLLDVVPLQLVYRPLYLLRGQISRGAGLADVLERRFELLGERDDEKLDAFDDLHAALVSELVLRALLREEIPDEPAYEDEYEVRKGARCQVEQLAHFQAPLLPRGGCST